MATWLRCRSRAEIGYLVWMVAPLVSIRVVPPGLTYATMMWAVLMMMGVFVSLGCRVMNVSTATPCLCFVSTVLSWVTVWGDG